MDCGVARIFFIHKTRSIYLQTISRKILQNQPARTPSRCQDAEAAHAQQKPPSSLWRLRIRASPSSGSSSGDHPQVSSLSNVPECQAQACPPRAPTSTTSDLLVDQCFPPHSRPQPTPGRPQAAGRSGSSPGRASSGGPPGSAACRGE